MAPNSITSADTTLQTSDTGTGQALQSRPKSKAWYVRRMLATSDESINGIAELCGVSAAYVYTLRKLVNEPIQQDRVDRAIAELSERMRGLEVNLAWVKAELVHSGNGTTLPGRPISKAGPSHTMYSVNGVTA